jgi:hypothetical protein
MNIVLDMSQTGYMGPESLGSLIRLESRMRRRREQLWLAELPSHLGAGSAHGQLHNYFMTTTMVSDALYRTAKAEQRCWPASLPTWDMNRQEAAFVDVRVELLQDVCRRIISAEETEGNDPGSSCLRQCRPGKASFPVAARSTGLKDRPWLR